MVVLVSDLLELVMLNDNEVIGIFFAFTVMENTRGWLQATLLHMPN